MNNGFVRIILLIIGIIVVIIGIAGLFLPILQGLLFVFIGLFILSFASPRFKWHMHKTCSRWPKFHEKMLKAESRIDEWLKKHFDFNK